MAKPHSPKASSAEQDLARERDRSRLLLAHEFVTIVLSEPDASTFGFTAWSFQPRQGLLEALDN